MGVGAGPERSGLTPHLSWETSDGFSQYSYICQCGPSRSRQGRDPHTDGGTYLVHTRPLLPPRPRRRRCDSPRPPAAAHGAAHHAFRVMDEALHRANLGARAVQGPGQEVTTSQREDPAMTQLP